MDRQVSYASAPAVRALIACAYLGETRSPHQLGAITLHPHQRDAVARLRALMQEHGGALLADEVGLGKTYVAVTLIRECSRALVVAPASLRAMWKRALSAAGAHADLASYHELSRGEAPAGKFDLVVLDEAHHARNPATLRFRRLAELTAGARVLLLSATPIHNRRADLAAPLALFLGARAFTLGARELSAFVVRRERADVVASAPLPEAGRPQWLSVREDQGLLDGILALPPPVP
ncbi:MAG: SNF2-related protein, partial [Gemmatimonadaceae bacterium]